MSLVVTRTMAAAAYGDDAAASTECSELATCAECRRAERCGWSSERQTCGTTAGAGNVQTGCSSVRAVAWPVAGGDASATYAYAIVVSGDGADVRLADADLRCHVGDTVARAAGVQVHAGGPATVRIECPPVPVARLLRDGRETDVRHAHVAADGVPLWPDRPDDRYFAVNRNARCDRRRRDWTDECARCAWMDGDGYAHYARLCPGRVVPCAGPRAFYDRRPAATLLAREQPRPAVVAVPPSPCPQLRVRSFAPARGPWTGGFTLRVHVTNHAVLSERAVPVVTVAGRPCRLQPVAAGGRRRDDQVTCTVAPFAASDRVDARGPVRVRYDDDADGSQGAASAVELASVEEFAFDYPRVANVSRHSTLGLDRGGRTELTVSGEHLDAGREVRVTVGDARCEVTDRSSDRMRCMVDGVDAATVGRITVWFCDGPRAAALRVHVVQSPWSVRLGDPALAPEQPSYAGIESGGTTVTVRGVRLFGLGDARIHVRRPDDGTWTAGDRCRVRHDDYMTCRSPDVRTLVRAPAVLESSVTAEDVDGRPLRLAAPWYLVHPDPTFDEAFDVTENGSALTVRAHGLAVGHATEDVVIRSTATGRRACRVTVVTDERVACVSDDGAALPADLRAVTVAVGNALRRVVTRRTADPVVDDGGGEGLTFVRALCHVLRTVLRVTVIAGVAFVIWKLAMACYEPGPQVHVKFCTSVESVRQRHHDSDKA